MKCWKLTDQNGQTRGGTQWGPGVTHEAKGSDPELCSNGWLHFYESPLLAILHNPIHANIDQPRLWEAEAEGEILREGYMKAGCRRLTTVREVEVPQVTIMQCVAYGILCALATYKDKAFADWAEGWLSGKDRTEQSAAWAARAAEAAEAAEAAGAARAAGAAWAAGAARAARTAGAAGAARTAVAAGAADPSLDLMALAEKAMAIK